jgi:murein DD-endopeptidase MepM/ murein hydrolase activator NlpD
MGLFTLPRGLAAAAAAFLVVRACGPAPSSNGFVYPISPKAAGWAPATWTQDQGVDINAPCGTTLVAVSSGQIIGEGISGFGKYAPELLADAGPLKDRMIYYGHVQRDLVPVGAHVKAGQPIAEVGTLGISRGCHVEMGVSELGSTYVPTYHATSATMLKLLTDAYQS